MIHTNNVSDTFIVPFQIVSHFILGHSAGLMGLVLEQSDFHFYQVELDRLFFICGQLVQWQRSDKENILFQAIPPTGC